MNKLLIILLATTLTTTGCIAFSQVEKNRKLIDISDGIDETEALLVAQINLLTSDFKPYDKVIPAKIRTDEAAQKYSDYWFVNYSPAVTSNYPSLLMVINKQTGEVIFTKEYWPKVVKDLDWVFKR